MQFVTFHDKKIVYDLQGKGESVLFVHGFCEDRHVWDAFTPAIAAAGYAVLTLDLPGFGDSEVLPHASIEIMADAVHALLLHLQLEKTVFIGHSMGGYVGLAFAQKYGDQLLGLGLFHSHPYADSAEKKEARRRSIDLVRTKGTAWYVRQLIPGLFTPSFAQNQPMVVDQLVQRAATYASEGIINALQAMHDRPDQSTVLKNAAFPILFIIGKADTAVPADASKQQTTLPDTSSILLLEAVAHMGMLEAKEQTQQAILGFVEWCVFKIVNRRFNCF